MTDSSLARQLFALKLYALLSSAVLIPLVLSGFRTTSQSSFDVIRVKGIVVEDALGHDRILIGAPIPSSKDRVRTNFDKAVASWGPRFGGKMEWFKNLNQSTNGIVVMNDRGFDRLVIGDPYPDPNIGKRIDAGPGLAFNDANGFERAGFGYFDKINRVSLGLDSDKGEGAGLIVDKDGTAGAWFNGSGRDSGFVGWSPPNGIENSGDRAFFGLMLNRGGKVAHKSGLESPASK